MKSNSLSAAVKELEKTEIPVKGEKQEKTENSENTNKSYSPNSNLPQIRKVALARRRVGFIMLVALFVSCFSLSVFVGYFGPFLLFK